jgi:transcriptional regulator with XRE-family HTH domain
MNEDSVGHRKGEPSMNETIGTRIRKVRESRGMSQSDLARLAGVTPAAVWNWETHGTRPRHDTLASVAKVLGVTVEHLVSGDTGPIGSLHTVDDILKRAAAELAQILVVDVDRISVRFELS